jgi:hypothetical protein
MSRHEASFEIESKTDAYAVRRILERTYDTIREETRSVRDGSEDATALLREFEALRDAANDPDVATGTLTITYERDDGADDD